MEVYWSHYTSLGELSLCFANSTLICQRFPLFSLQRMLKKTLVNVKCRESSQVTHHWSIFSTLTAFPSWVKIRHGKNRENTSCMSPPPTTTHNPISHGWWSVPTCWDQLSAFLVQLQLVGTNPQPHLHGWWWWSVTKPFLRASATRWSLRQRERRDVQGQGHEGHVFSWLTAHAEANHHLLFNALQKELSKPSQALWPREAGGVCMRAAWWRRCTPCWATDEIAQAGCWCKDWPWPSQNRITPTPLLWAILVIYSSSK